MTDAKGHDGHGLEGGSGRDGADDGLDDGLDDLKARMRDALARKNAQRSGVRRDAPVREKAHGSEVAGGGPRMHRRKAGGGGA